MAAKQHVRGVGPECAAPGCEEPVKRNRHSDRHERPWNLYCSRTCYYTMERRYRDGLCIRGHEMTVTGTRVNNAGKEVPKRNCPTCRRATRFARLYGVDMDTVLEFPPPDACELCGKPGRLVLDHNHQTAEVRGWLCGPCNSGIGYLQDSPELIRAAALYLEQRGHYG